MQNKHLLIVMSGPSGVGKGTIIDELMARGNFALSVSCTTREPRDGEAEGVNYFYIGKDKFLNTLREGGFLEYSEHFHNYYGTPRKFVESKLESCDVILEIDVNGAMNVKKSFPDALLIMIAPPDIKTLEARLRQRGTESEAELAERLDRAAYELSRANEYDYVVINDVIEDAVEQLEKIIEGARSSK